MKPPKKTASFIDANGHRAVINCEITNRNGYPKFTASGTYCGSGGQCQDEIKPRTEKQKELMNLWEKYHLKDVSDVFNFDENLIGIIDVINYEDKAEQEAKPELTGNDKIFALMTEQDINEDNLNACRAYLEVMGADDLADFQEIYSGQFDSDEDFAEDMAENCGYLNKDADWPNNCIDWEKASRYLMMDYTEQDGFYFRNL